MYHYLLSLLFISAVAGRLFHSTRPKARPTIPEQFSVKVYFNVPKLTQLKAELFWQEEESCIRTNVEELVQHQIAPHLHKIRVKDACEQFGVGPTEDIYFPVPLGIKTDEDFEAWAPTAQAWTSEKGFIDAPVDEVCIIYFMFAPYLADVFSLEQWSNMQPTDAAETIDGVKLNGWRAPETVVLNGIVTTFYATDDGTPKYLVFEGDPGYGLRATLPIKFDDFVALENASVCSPPQTITDIE